MAEQRTLFDFGASPPVVDRYALGKEIAATLGDRYGAASALSRAVAVTPAHVSDILHGRKTPSADVLARIADHLGVDDATRDRWLALAGHVEPRLLAALLASPERWGEVRAVLGVEEGDR